MGVSLTQNRIVFWIVESGTRTESHVSDAFYRCRYVALRKLSRHFWIFNPYRFSVDKPRRKIMKTF